MHTRVEASTDVAMVGAWDASRANDAPGAPPPMIHLAVEPRKNAVEFGLVDDSQRGLLGSHTELAWERVGLERVAAESGAKEKHASGEQRRSELRVSIALDRRRNPFRFGIGDVLVIQSMPKRSCERASLTWTYTTIRDRLSIRKFWAGHSRSGCTSKGLGVNLCRHEGHEQTKHDR